MFLPFPCFVPLSLTKYKGTLEDSPSSLIVILMIALSVINLPPKAKKERRKNKEGPASYLPIKQSNEPGLEPNVNPILTIRPFEITQCNSSNVF